MGKQAYLVLAFILIFIPGCLYSNIRVPWDTDLAVTELGSKEGRSTIYSILGLVSWGDGGTKAAAKEGQITVLRHMDREVFVLLFGFYARTTTIVYGD